MEQNQLLLINRSGEKKLNKQTIVEAKLFWFHWCHSRHQPDTVERSGQNEVT